MIAFVVGSGAMRSSAFASGHAATSPRRVSCGRGRVAAGAVRMEALNPDESKPMKEMVTLEAKGKMPVCRCWKSKKHPACDGSHNAYNKETGDSLGPLVISVAKAE